VPSLLLPALQSLLLSLLQPLLLSLLLLLPLLLLLLLPLLPAFLSSSALSSAEPGCTVALACGCGAWSGHSSVARNAQPFCRSHAAAVAKLPASAATRDSRVANGAGSSNARCSSSANGRCVDLSEQKK
jgi:hypothetical protein